MKSYLVRERGEERNGQCCALSYDCERVGVGVGVVVCVGVVVTKLYSKAPFIPLITSSP